MWIISVVFRCKTEWHEQDSGVVCIIIMSQMPGWGHTAEEDRGAWWTPVNPSACFRPQHLDRVLPQVTWLSRHPQSLLLLETGLNQRALCENKLFVGCGKLKRTKCEVLSQILCTLGSTRKIWIGRRLISFLKHSLTTVITDVDLSLSWLRKHVKSVVPYLQLPSQQKRYATEPALNLLN